MELTESISSKSPPANTRASRLGRTAWMVFGIGVGMGAVMFSTIFIQAVRQNPDAELAILGVSLSVASVCTLWSIALAVRAIRAGERLAGPVLLLIDIPAIGMGLIGLAWWVNTLTTRRFYSPWFWKILWDAFPVSVIMPVFSLTVLTLAPLILRILRSRERRALEQNQQKLSRKARWLFLLVWGAICLLIVFAFSLVACLLIWVNVENYRSWGYF